MSVIQSTLLLLVVILFAALHASVLNAGEGQTPNVIVILADDMGYGDTSHNGHPGIKTPHLDRMATEGQNWTHFYAAASVCSPSRAALLTGRLPIRSGVASSKHRVFFPWSKGGLPADEFTIAELFQNQGYKTAMIGKWHLGHLPEFLPTRHGFDRWFGIPYSNDMDKTDQAKKILNRQPGEDDFPTEGWYEPRSEWFQVPLMRNEIVLERGPDQRLLTQRYADESIEFIRQNRNRPFFLYLAFSMPHVPLFRSASFAGRSQAGVYGDVIEELDDAVGRILKALRALKLERNTLVVFTSDNGPWLKYKTLGGSAGPLREGKSSTWEGGFRVPTIFWAPGMIRPQSVDEMGSTLDFMATFSALTGGDLPDVQLDSVNLLPVLTEGKSGSREDMFFYMGDQLAAVRRGDFKIHFWVPDANNRKAVLLEAPLLYNLVQDPAESLDIASSNPGIVASMTRLRDNHLTHVAPAGNQLNRR